MIRAIDLPGLGAARLGAYALFAVAASQPAGAQVSLVAAPSSSEAPAAPPVVSAPTATPPPLVTPAPPGTPQCPPPAADAAPCIAALTPVKIKILVHLGSKLSLSGQTFPLALAEPIMIDGKEVIPAGTTGMGEVVHAKNSGGSGASGELVLAARYLELGDRRLRLRSLNFAVAGQDSIKGVNNLMIASAATMPALSLIGFFVKGKGIDIPEGLEAMAKTAEPFVLDPLPIVPLATVPAPISTPSEQGKTP